MRGFQWRKSLCSLHWKGRTILLFFLCFFFLAKDTQEFWAAAVLEKRLIRPKDQCPSWGCSLTDSVGPGVEYATRRWLNPSGMVPLEGLPSPISYAKTSFRRGGGISLLHQLAYSGTTASHLWDLWEGKATLTNWPHLCGSPKHPYLGESLAIPCLCKGPDTLRDSQLLWTSWGKLLGSKFH